MDTDFIRMATFAREMKLSPSRISQLKRRGVFETVSIDGVDHISQEEAARFKALKRPAGRKPKVSMSSLKLAKVFLRKDDNDC